MVGILMEFDTSNAVKMVKRVLGSLNHLHLELTPNYPQIIPNLGTPRSPSEFLEAR